MMKYEESLYIEENGHYKEIIHLHDLQQSLVLNASENPYEILLLDMQNQQVLARFQYGYSEDYEGFSFAVSPRHNYLIIKEIRYGLSADELYTTLYALTKTQTEHNTCSQTHSSTHSRYDQLQPAWFQSYNDLEFIFSNDEEESTIYTHGETIDNLELICTYHAGGTEADNRQVKLRQTYCYPKVSLNSDIVEKRLSLNLANDKVVKNLTQLKREHNKSLFRLNIPTLTQTVNALLNQYYGKTTMHWHHTLLGSSALGSDSDSLTHHLNQLNIPYQKLTNEDKSIDLISIILPILFEPTYTIQSIEHINQSAAENGFMYLGFSLDQNRKIDHWSYAVNSCYALYENLSVMLSDNIISIQDFPEYFHQLQHKHDACHLESFFSPEQRENLASVNQLLEEFDEWQIKAPELKERIRHCFAEAAPDT